MGNDTRSDHEVRGRRRAGAVAIVYCEGAFGCLDGKTAHGLVRRSARYHLLAVIDSKLAGGDAGEVLDGRARGVPIVESLERALDLAREDAPPTHLVIGLAPVGGALDAAALGVVERAIGHGLSVHSGLHHRLGDDPRLASLAAERGVEIVDVRRPPERSELHAYSGKIAEVDSNRVAVLGVDSGLGKRTTAWLLLDELRRGGRTAELIGTGQTAWLQGAEFCIPLDALVYDFVPGEIEHVVWRAWRERRPDFLVIEGQGGLLNPGYFGGQEILLAARPDVVVLQHAPGRAEYDGCPGHPIAPLRRQLEALRGLSDSPVAAITVSREGIAPAEMKNALEALSLESGVPAIDILAADGPKRLLGAIDQTRAGRH